MTGFKLAGGRALDPLLFVTDAARLRRRVGPWARTCLAAIRDAGHTVFDLEGEARVHRAVVAVRRGRLVPGVPGVGPLGGRTMVPARIVDSLPAAHRKQVQGVDDPDDFYVWSDEAYADR